MKKKYILIVCAVAMLFLMTGCKSRDTKRTEKLIDGIGSEGIISESEINAARENYEKLSDEEKAKVENYSILTEAEDQLLANAVIQHIANMGGIDENSMDKIDSLFWEYAELTPNQQAKVTNYVELVNARNMCIEIQTGIAIKKFQAICGENFDESEILDAKEYYQSLTEEVKESVNSKLGSSVDEVLKKARITLAEQKIRAITYSKGDTDKLGIYQIVEASDYFQNLDRESRLTVSNKDKLFYAIDSALESLKKSEKKNKAAQREYYISECQDISYRNLYEHPDDYKQKQVEMNVKVVSVKTGALFFSDTLICTDLKTGCMVCIKDKRILNEQQLFIDDVFTVYGEFVKIDKIKLPEDAVDLEGNTLTMNSKVSVPLIEAVYTSEDNLGLLVNKDPDSNYSENTDLTELRRRLIEAAEMIKE